MEQRVRQCGESGILPFQFPGVPSVRCLFTTAVFGNLSLDVCSTGDAYRQTQERRQRLFDMGGFTTWSELKQVHGNQLLLNPGATPVLEPSGCEADGHATTQQQHALIIKTADCQPVLLAHTSGSAIAALHVGWRGNAIEYIQSAVKNFCSEYSLQPEDLVAVRGPSLGPEAAEFVNFSQEWKPEFALWFSKEKKTMNLWQLTQYQLLHAGLQERHIYSLDLCTYSMPDFLFSYRRRHSGRQMSLIWIEE